MGFSDKFKDLKKQAQDAVADHREQIDDAVGAVGMAVDRKTKGRHTQKIANFGQKASSAVDKFADQGSEDPGSAPPSGHGPSGHEPPPSTPGQPRSQPPPGS